VAHPYRQTGIVNKIIDKFDRLAEQPFYHGEQGMADRNRQAAENAINTAPSAPTHSPQTKFTVFGEEMIQKAVGLGGNAGRIYLPPGWVGKRVKIIRVD
jgi:hypothetical protein